MKSYFKIEIITLEKTFLNCRSIPTGNFGEEPRWADENGVYINGKTEEGGIWINGHYTAKEALEDIKNWMG